jgi:mRNA interferase MazF
VLGRSRAGYLPAVDTLAIIVPVTSVDRGWPNHIPVVGATLPPRSWAVTEQVRTISRTRITESLGRVTSDTLAEIRLWIRDFLDL